MAGSRTRLLLAVVLTVALLGSTGAHAQSSIPVIVKLSPTANLTVINSVLGSIPVDSIAGANTYLYNLPVLPIVTAALSALGVQWVEPNTGVTLPPITMPVLLTLPASTLPDWYRYQPAMQLIGANEARAYATGTSVVVADINSQVDYAHPALAGHLTTGFDFVAAKAPGTAALNQASAGFLDQASAGFLDQASAGFLDQASAGFLDQASAGFLDSQRNPAYSHGTLCAGLIATVAPNAMIMPLRAFDDNGSAELFTLAKAIRYASSHGAQIINMSFGTLSNSKTMKEAIDFAGNGSVTLVASAGNADTAAVQYPAGFSPVIGVAATDLLDVKASFSNYGTAVRMDAPGVNIITAFPGDRYAIVSGTSFSAPLVAASAALVRSIQATGVDSALTGNAVPIDSRNPNYAGSLGYGRVDALQAVRPH